MLLRLGPGEYSRLFSEGIEEAPALPRAALRQRRQAAFRENLIVKARRIIRVAARFLRPRRIADLPATFDFLVREHLVKSNGLPGSHDAVVSADGLAGIAFDLSPASMMEAYGKGLSPSACLGPIAWHSRPRRFVARPLEIAKEKIRRPEGADPAWTVTFDREVDFVLAASGRPPDRSPIMPTRLLAGFADLFDAGFAHCFEVRNASGETVGGGFGVAVGGVFVLEGAFQKAGGAAQFGLAHLARRLGEWGFSLVECAPGAAWLGVGTFRPMPRDEFLTLVAQHMSEEKVGRWRNNDPPLAPRRPEPRRLAA
jgi:leucyl/phenylalanyl-tRNA--protein transferase